VYFIFLSDVEPWQSGKVSDFLEVRESHRKIKGNGEDQGTVRKKNII